MIRSLALALIIIVAGACAPVYHDTDPFIPGNEACVAVTVENQQFADVNVWVGQRRQRLGTVVGYNTERFEICDWRGVYAVFTVDPIGNAFRTFQKRAAVTYLSPSRPLRLIVGIRPTPSHSHVIGK